MKKYLMLIIIFVLTPVVFVSAHPGNTDSSGGHTCWTNCSYWGLSYGQYHYKNSPKIITTTPTTFSNTFSGYHGINYQGDCYDYEWYFSVYDKKVKEYLSSVEYIKEKDVWREKLKTKDGNFLKTNGASYESFLSNYEGSISSITTDLDDTDCFKPFQKLSEYTYSKIQAYDTEQKSLKNQIKRIFSWFK